MDSNACGALQLPWRTSTYPKTSLEFTIVGEDLECEGVYYNLRQHRNPLQPGERTVVYLDTLIVAVGNQNLASGGGSHSLKVGELALIPPLSSWNQQKKWREQLSSE